MTGFPQIKQVFIFTLCCGATHLNLAVLLWGNVTVWLPPHARAVVVATS